MSTNVVTVTEDNLDLTSSDGVAAFMRQTSSRKDWNERCDIVKKANGGDYPAFWYGTVIASGLYTEVMANIESALLVNENSEKTEGVQANTV